MQRGTTGHGYVYYRDRSCGNDDTVYEHQLMALEYFDSHAVFADEWDVHHLAPARDANVPEFLLLRLKDDHRSNGGDKWETYD